MASPRQQDTIFKDVLMELLGIAKAEDTLSAGLTDWPEWAPRQSAQHGARHITVLLKSRSNSVYRITSISHDMQVTEPRLHSALLSLVTPSRVNLAT